LTVEWIVRKYTGYDPEIGGVGYTDIIYSLSLEPRLGADSGVWQVMYNFLPSSLNPRRKAQPDHYKATYWTDLDLPFSIISVYVAQNEDDLERASQILSTKSVFFTMAEWNSVEDYLRGAFGDQDMRDMFLDPDCWRYSDCLSVAYILKTLLEKAQAITDGVPFDPGLLARLDQTFREEVEALEIAVSA
jgi:hypothetical protein